MPNEEVDYTQWLETTCGIVSGLLSIHHGISIDAAIDLFNDDIDKAIEGHNGKTGVDNWMQLTRKIMAIMLRELERPTI